MQWPEVFTVASERRYIPQPDVPPFVVEALCDIKVGKRIIRTGDTIGVDEIVVQANRDGWLKVGYVVTVGRTKGAVPATKFVTAHGDCPNDPDGTFMVDWTYDDERPYRRKGK